MHCFSQPAKPQLSSSLMSLPAEIRCHIWHLLLKSTQTLITEAEYEYRERRELQRATSADHDSGCLKKSISGNPLCSNLSAQVLACCQQLYRECEPILYEENTISIFCLSVKCDHFYFYQLCFALDREWLLPDRATEADMATLVETTSYRILSRFQTYHLFMNVHFTQEVRIFRLLLATTLLNKKVTFEVDKSDHIPIDERWLSSLGNIRCESVHFEG